MLQPYSDIFESSCNRKSFKVNLQKYRDFCILIEGAVTNGLSISPLSNQQHASNSHHSDLKYVAASCVLLSSSFSIPIQLHFILYLITPHSQVKTLSTKIKLETFTIYASCKPTFGVTHMFLLVLRVLLCS